MSTKKIVSWLLLLFGEATIITTFILFRGETPNNILILNIIVATIIYGAFFVDILVPWVNFNDKSQRRIGSLGIRWVVTFFYAMAAIALIIVANRYYEFNFSSQLMIHCGLFFLFLLGLLAASYASDKVENVYNQETVHRIGIIEMKNAMKDLKDKMNEINGLPNSFIQQVDTIEAGLRFISPTNNEEAYILENSFVDTVNNMMFSISDFSMNEEHIMNSLKKLEHLYKNRKNIYSN